MANENVPGYPARAPRAPNAGPRGATAETHTRASHRELYSDRTHTARAAAPRTHGRSDSQPTATPRTLGYVTQATRHAQGWHVHTRETESLSTHTRPRCYDSTSVQDHDITVTRRVCPGSTSRSTEGRLTFSTAPHFRARACEALWPPSRAARPCRSCGRRWTPTAPPCRLPAPMWDMEAPPSKVRPELPQAGLISTRGCPGGGSEDR